MGIRPPVGLPTISKRAKRVLIVLISLAVLAILWFQFVGVYVDYLWFGEVGIRQVFTTEVISRIVLFLIAGLGGGGLVFLSFMLAYRSRQVFVPTAAEVDPLAPYRTVLTSRPKLFSIGLAGLIGLICGLSAQGNWSTVQLWLHGTSFGTVDPQFGHDVGFYVFTLPFYQMILGWLFVITAVCFVAILITQYIFGGIRASGPGRKISSAATLQLSLLVGVFVLIKAVQYWFDRYNLLFSNRGGIFTGASYTDVNAVLPAKIILMVIAAICAVGFFVGAFLRSVKLPAIALALLVLSSVLIGGVWPLVLQQVVVNPNGLSKEPEYISRNIDATRNAYSIRDDQIDYQDYSGQLTNQPIDIVNDKGTVPNARLLDPNILSATFTQQQQQQNFYGFPAQLSVDRYTINGKTQDFVVAARELDVDGLQANQKNWINEHLVFTHGNGFVAAPANQVNGGYPNYTVSDLTTKGAIPVTQPRIYYGELATDYAIVGTDVNGRPREYDTTAANYTYTGSGGVPVGNLFKRLVFATSYGEANFLFSSEITPDSKIMYHRDPRERVQLAAPFLTVDTKPYPAVVDGRIVWIVDGYTTAQNYPYSRTVSLSDVTSNSTQLRGAAAQTAASVSYIRNSVKATVDAYDGTVKLYQFDDQDPVLKAWEGVFPGLIQPKSAISPDLMSHMRYPQDLFEVQRSLLVRYHVDDPREFFQNSGFWKVPNDPTVTDSYAQPPYYLEVTVPGTKSPSFELTSPLTSFEREIMAAYMSVSSDPSTYGRFTVLKFPATPQTPGPAQVQSLFRQTQEIASAITLSTQAGGARVVFGNLLALPVNGTLLYVEPFYIQNQSNTSLYAQLNKVLVWYANRVGVGATLTEALTAAANSAPVQAPEPDPGTGAITTPPTSTAGQSIPSSSGSTVIPTTPGTTTTGPLPANEAQARTALDTALKNLDVAKKSGDLAQIGQASQALEVAVQRYLDVVGTNVATTGATPRSSGSPPPGSSSGAVPSGGAVPPASGSSSAGSTRPSG